VNQERSKDSPIDAQLAAPPVANPGTKGTAQQLKSGVTTVADSRGMVLAILFGVTGALGIPLLWMSNRFSLAERIFWSIVVIFYTTALVGVTAAIVMWSFRLITGG
jgi:hypothetical protein